MKINSKIDSNAVSLDSRNFGSLEREIAKKWMTGLVHTKQQSTYLPKKAIIEITNTCNLDCPMCRVGQFGVDLTRTMPINKFQKLLDSLKTLKKVRLNGLGESTLVPHFSDYVQELSNRNIAIELISNGTGSVEDYEYVLAAGGKVFISWDSPNRNLFEILRRPANWDHCVNILKLISNKADHKSLSLLFTLQKANVGQLCELVLFAIENNIHQILVNVIKTDNYHWFFKRSEEIKIDFEEALTKAKSSNLMLMIPNQIGGQALQVDGAKITSGSGCSAPWNEVLIRWNGDIQVCNMFNPYTYGNIHLNSFPKIWNNSFASLFRDMINTDNAHPYCMNCVYVSDGYE